MAVASSLYRILIASPRLIRTSVKAMSVVAPPPSYDFSETKTPADFVRFHPSVPLPLPTIRHVGLLACQLDPLLRTLQTKVLSAAPSAPPPAPAPAKGAKVKRKTATDVPELKVEAEKGKIFEIELEDTALFPEGGGQNSDSGTMEVAGHKLKVLHVLRKGLKAVHYVVVPEEVEPKLSAGADVAVEVDWERRMDLMTHHTSQHLLSALLDSLPHPATTLSWSLTPAPAPCYIEISRNITPEEIADVEGKANRLIHEGTRVFVEVEDQEEGKGLSAEEQAQVRESRKGIPKDYEKGVVRTINIEGVDRNPCCGTHLPSLSLLSSMHILPTTTPHSSTTRRLYFVTSARLANYTRTSSTIIASLSSTLGGAPAAMLPERVFALSDASKIADKNVKSLKSELAELVGEGLKSKLDEEATKGVVYKHRDAPSEATAGTDFLGAASLVAFPTQPVEGEAGRLLVLSSSIAIGQSALHLSGTPSLVSAFGERVKQASLFAGGRVKGGGAKGKWQAKVEGTFGPAEQAWVEGALQEIRGSL